MKNKNLEKEAEEIMKLKGNTKGSEILTLKSYILDRYGKEGLRKLEEKMREVGFPVNFKEIKPAHWYPEALNVLAMIVAKEIFNWKDLYEFGYNSPIFSFGVKVFIKFLPFRLFISLVPSYWKEFLDVGKLEIVDFSEKEKFVILQLKNYTFHPAMCKYFAGFFLRISEAVVKSEKISIQETKCVFKGDSYHEYKIEWK